MKNISWRKRIINLPHVFFVLIWASFFLPSRYAEEMRGGLNDFKAFGAALVILEIIFLIKTGNEKKHRAQLDIFAFLYGFLLVWEVCISRLNLLPYAFGPEDLNVEEEQ